ncbi:hypothetical protein UFOVP75_213 [uncultured Caudovirales phage]|uniref:Uncharacterized protein n=1 Tax=uncultured Caudovirales phage TaxID=2100421 RepID=A0A6J5KZH6_9CAUD|nr:hypothetical protein UFOVP75_213 [uncultured Caudovirales phage]
MTNRYFTIKCPNPHNVPDRDCNVIAMEDCPLCHGTGQYLVPADTSMLRELLAQVPVGTGYDSFLALRGLVTRDGRIAPVPARLRKWFGDFH